MSEGEASDHDQVAALSDGGTSSDTSTSVVQVNKNDDTSSQTSGLSGFAYLSNQKDVKANKMRRGSQKNNSNSSSRKQLRSMTMNSVSEAGSVGGGVIRMDSKTSDSELKSVSMASLGEDMDQSGKGVRLIDDSFCSDEMAMEQGIHDLNISAEKGKAVPMTPIVEETDADVQRLATNKFSFIDEDN